MKVIASDFDGTLRRHGVISKRDRQAVVRWRKEGNLFGVVTGRDYEQACFVIKKHRIAVDFVICCTGAIITDGKFNVICEEKGCSEAIPELAEYTLSLNPEYFHASNYGEVYYVPCGKEPVRDGGTALTSKEMSEIPFFHQVNTCFENDEQALEYITYVNERYGEYFNAFRNGRFVDIPPAGISKTEGIYRYMKIVGAEKKDVTTVGDNFNDIGMITEFGGCAVGRARDEVKAAAKTVCEGIAELIEKLE